MPDYLLREFGSGVCEIQIAGKKPVQQRQGRDCDFSHAGGTQGMTRPTLGRTAGLPRTEYATNCQVFGSIVGWAAGPMEIDVINIRWLNMGLRQCTLHRKRRAQPLRDVVPTCDGRRNSRHHRGAARWHGQLPADGALDKRKASGFTD